MGNLDSLIAALRLRVNRGEAVANSRDVAKFFERRHADVLRQIEQLKVNEEIDSSWFRESYGAVLIDGHLSDSCDMTRDGFVLLALSWTGETGRALNSSYIEAFNALNDSLQNRHKD